jgi:hypothetical protein
MNVTFLKLNEINSRLIEAALDTPFSYEWLFNHSELGKTLLTMKTTTQEPTVEGGKVITVWCEKPPHLSHHKWSHEQEIVHKLHIGGYFRISHKKNGGFVALEWRGLSCTNSTNRA